MQTNQTPSRHTPRVARLAGNPRHRGVTAVLAMLFLMIFGSLAAAMAIVSQGNLRTADSHLKINRSMAAAETGMDVMIYRLKQVTQGDPDVIDTTDPSNRAHPFYGLRTPDGLIDAASAQDLWTGPLPDNTMGLADRLAAAFAGEPNFDTSGDPYVDTTSFVDFNGNAVYQLVVPAIQIGPHAPAFTATMTPHPLPDGVQAIDPGYDDPFYDRLPYGAPGGLPGSAQYKFDMQIKREAGIEYIVSEAVGYDTKYELKTQPLDARFIRVKVTAFDGDLGNAAMDDPDSADYDPELSTRRRVYRSISMDFRLDKTVPYAVLSRSRVMIGRNVQIHGNVGSRFAETDKKNGHPIQVQSDFLGLKASLDEALAPPSAGNSGGGAFHNEVVLNDIDGDNRLNILNPSEVNDLPQPAATYDKDGDGYISDFDYFLAAFDEEGSGNNDGRVSKIEFVESVNEAIKSTAEQLFDMMDTAGADYRDGYNDGFIDSYDLYAKIRGRVSLSASTSDWNDGVSTWGDDGSGSPPAQADYLYKDYMQGVIKPNYGEAALTTGDPALDVHTFTQHSFDTKSFYELTNEDVTGDTASGGSEGSDLPGFTGEFFEAGTDPSPRGTFEEVPYGAAYPYDYYERPVYRNKVFTGARIKLGANARFENCRFIGVTFIEISPDNGDENFNYVGMQESDGTPKHPDYEAEVNGTSINSFDKTNKQIGTKQFGNNVRFHNCAFEGPVVSGDNNGNQPTQFTHVRNKVTFTGTTRFDFDKAPNEELKTLYKRSSLLLPHMSVEMGSFEEGDSSSETLELSGAVVAGLIDMRGQINIRGTLITTFEPISGQAPVKGDTSPQFNTTLGYFSQGQGDLEAALPSGGLGKIKLTYDPTLALPDGIDGPLELRPLIQTYHETGR